jgi:biopolymer transport protein ExbD
MSGKSAPKRTFKRKPRASVNPDMNVTPLVDVVLVLLIIFMVLAPVVSAHYLGRLPPPDDEDQALAEQNPDNKPLVLKVSERELDDGTVTPVFSVGTIELEVEEAPNRLGRLVAGRTDKVIYVDAADSTDYGHVLQAMSFAKDAEGVVNSLVREQAAAEGRESGGILRVTAVLVTKEIPLE